MEVAIRHRRNTTSKPPDHTRLAHRTSETDRPKKGGRILVAGDAAARQAGRPRRTPASAQRPPRRVSAFSHFLSLPPLPPSHGGLDTPPLLLRTRGQRAGAGRRLDPFLLPRRGDCCCCCCRDREHGHRRRYAAAAGWRAAIPPWTKLPPPAPRYLAYVSTLLLCFG